MMLADDENNRRLQGGFETLVLVRGRGAVITLLPTIGWKLNECVFLHFMVPMLAL
jgi:hypothetical protein